MTMKQTDRLDQMTTISVETQTLADDKAGKKLFGGFAEEYEKAGMEMGQVLSIGVLEAGTVGGLPSVMLLIKVNFKNDKGESDHLFIGAETTGRNFMVASQIANGNIERLIKDFENRKKNEAMT